MADISGIPSHVPQEYKDQLQSFQSQIKILLQNHQVGFSHNQINRRHFLHSLARGVVSFIKYK